MARLQSLRVRNLKSLEDVRLGLDGLTVLIGDNGTGKSSILESLELLRTSILPSGTERIRKYHGGPSSLTRHGEDKFSIGVELSTGPHKLEYSISQSLNRKHPQGEIWRTSPGQSRQKIKTGIENMAEFANVRKIQEKFTIRQDSADREKIESTLMGMDVHLPFDVSANWASTHRGHPSAIRKPTTLENAERLSLFGDNITSVFHKLKNSFGTEHWNETMTLIRLGLGHNVRDVMITAIGDGKVRLALDLGISRPVPAYALADGELSYLAFVGLIRLDEGRTLLAFDEPETHLHPALLTRVISLLEDAASNYPVILSTHSDQLLDCLGDPVKSIVVCEVDQARSTHIRRLSTDQFDKWREDYRGVGNIRAEGQLSSILDYPTN